MPVTDPKQALAEANGLDQAAMQAQADADEAQAVQAPAQDEAAPYADLIAAVTDTQALAMHDALVAQLADRATFEAERAPHNMNIQKTLSKLAKKQITPGIVRGMVVTGCDATVINRVEMGEKRRNVYALEKLHDLLYAAVTGHMGNAINRAIVASMVKLTATRGRSRVMPNTRRTGSVTRGSRCAGCTRWPPTWATHRPGGTVIR